MCIGRLQRWHGPPHSSYLHSFDATWAPWNVHRPRGLREQLARTRSSFRQITVFPYISFFSFFFFFLFDARAYIGDWLLEIMLIRVESRLDSRQTRCRLSSLSLFLRTFIKNDAESSIITDDRGKRRTRLPCTRVESTTQFGEKRERERESG